jgi:hypothetical protein
LFCRKRKIKLMGCVMIFCTLVAMADGSGCRARPGVWAGRGSGEGCHAHGGKKGRGVT